MADCDLAETRRNRIHPCCCICGYREVLTPRTLRCRADVVRAGDGILDHQIGAVDERRLDCAGVQSLCSCRSTAAEPAMCGVDIEVPWKNAQPEPSPGQPAGLPTHVIELRTFTPTDVTSGLTAKSTFVGPWPLKPARMSLLASVMNSWNVADAEASGGFAGLSA